MQTDSIRKDKPQRKVSTGSTAFGGRNNDEGIEHLVTTQNTTQISQIDLREQQISARGVLLMGKADWKNLTVMVLGTGMSGPQNIPSSKIGDAGCKYLSRIPLPSLTALDLSMNQISQVGLAHLSKASWPTLSTFHLTRCGNYQSNTVRMINKMSHSRQLCSLYLDLLFLQESSISQLFLSEISGGLNTLSLIYSAIVLSEVVKFHERIGEKWRKADVLYDLNDYYNS